MGRECVGNNKEFAASAVTEGRGSPQWKNTVNLP